MLSNFKEICKKCKWFDPSCDVACPEEDCAGCAKCDDYNNCINYKSFFCCLPQLGD